MSEAALKWASDQTTPDPLSKFLLFRLAAYADAQGSVWVFVRLLAEEMGVSERTVQNRLKVLFAAELLEETGRTFRTRSNRIVPVRRLPLERAGLRATDIADDRPSTGEALCTPLADQDACTGEQTFTPEASPCTPMGEAACTPIRKEGEPKETSKEVSTRKREIADGFEDWWIAYPHKVEKRGAEAIYGRLIRSGEVSIAELLDGARRYANRVRGREERLIKHPTTWLSRGCWEDESGPSPTQAQTQQGSPRTGFAGPAELRDQIAALKGEAWVRSWIDPCCWDPEHQSIQTATAFAAGRLRQELGRHLRDWGISVSEPSEAAR
ncbi:MAG: hypothetical protein Q8K11_10705 [Phenylobacterium sp.]|uniref:helix-turn-helix domain-containing protein n=1 Tax=Phenylobacterium sp. TaxID=1871053 RepID=UPI00273082EC|nr:helix-turn-helix domain-containing protein [Phenylobacterium sp.]MDP2010638.1 hypothetical protein [Phenylobacterium sp.]